MKPERRAALAHATLALAFAGASVLAAGCSSLLGIEEFTPALDGSADSNVAAESGGDGPGPDVTPGDDTSSTVDSGSSPNDSSTTDTMDAHDSGDACVPGTASCPSGQVCVTMGSHTCCALATCENRCGTISDTCGGMLACPACSAGQVCIPMTATCCTPDGTCGGPCLDNCHQSDPTCCDAGM
jgi:hypothetical protein